MLSFVRELLIKGFGWGWLSRECLVHGIDGMWEDFDVSFGT